MEATPEPTPHSTSSPFCSSAQGLVSEEGRAAPMSLWGGGHMRTCVLVSVSSHCEQKSSLLLGGECCDKAALS